MAKSYARQIIRQASLTSEYAPVSETSEVCFVTLSAPATNQHTANVLGDDGATDVPMSPGQQFPLHAVDLADIRLKGTAGDVITIIGSST